jgi:hypothetical protein
MIKVGDLVKYKNLHGHVADGKFISKHWTGLVLELEKTKNKKSIRVMWSSGITGIESKESLEVISEIS